MRNFNGSGLLIESVEVRLESLRFSSFLFKRPFGSRPFSIPCRLDSPSAAPMAPADGADGADGAYARFRALERLESEPKAKPSVKIFGFDEEYTYGLLEPVFRNLPKDCDHEKLSEKTFKDFCKKLDECEATEEYLDSLMELSSEITRECTGKDFSQWRLGPDALQELRKAWNHFVRLIQVCDFEWENLVQYLSDPHAGWNAPGEYAKANAANMSKIMRFVISQKLMVPLQMWTLLLKLANDDSTSDRAARPRRIGYV